MVKKKISIIIFFLLLFLLSKNAVSAACPDTTRYPPIPITANTVNQGKFDLTINMIGSLGAVNTWDQFMNTKYYQVDQTGFFIVVSDSNGNVLQPQNAVSNAGIEIVGGYFHTHQSFTATFAAVTAAAAGTYYIHVIAKEDYLNVVKNGKADFSQTQPKCSFEQSNPPSVTITGIAPDEYLTKGEACHVDAQGVPSNPKRVLCSPNFVCRNLEDSLCNKCTSGCTCQDPLDACTTAPCLVCAAGTQFNYYNNQCINLSTGTPTNPELKTCPIGQACSHINGCGDKSTRAVDQPLSVCGNGTSCLTALGSLPTDLPSLLTSIFNIVLAIAGVTALGLIIASGYKLMVSQGNPEQVKGAREQLTAAIIGLLFIIFSLVILQVIGGNILNIPGFT